MDNKVYDQREDLHELKKFKNDKTSNSDLSSCPFCGRAARFDVVPCGSDFSRCTPGYKLIPPEGTDCEFDFYICQSKEDRPWETE